MKAILQEKKQTRKVELQPEDLQEDSLGYSSRTIPNQHGVLGSSHIKIYDY